MSQTALKTDVEEDAQNKSGMKDELSNKSGMKDEPSDKSGVENVLHYQPGNEDVLHYQSGVEDILLHGLKTRFPATIVNILVKAGITFFLLINYITFLIINT